MLGEKIKMLRESKGLLQREIAEALMVDTAYISKMEHNEKPISKNHIKALSKVFRIPEDDLYTIWLADRFYDLAKDEPVALKAIEVAKVELVNNFKKVKK